MQASARIKISRAPALHALHLALVLLEFQLFCVGSPAHSRVRKWCQNMLTKHFTRDEFLPARLPALCARLVCWAMRFEITFSAPRSAQPIFSVSFAIFLTLYRLAEASRHGFLGRCFVVGAESSYSEPRPCFTCYRFDQPLLSSTTLARIHIWWFHSDT